MPTTTQKTVKPYGPLNARLCIIGSSPSLDDINNHPPRPFTGADGHKLRQLVTTAGIDWDSIHFDTVMDTVAPYGEMKSFTIAALANGVRTLRERIAALTDVWVFVPLGNYATFALTGLGKVSPGLRKHCIADNLFPKSETTADIGITNLRGSVYEFNGHKVIPSIHPQAIRHSGHTRHPETACVADWGFISDELKFPHIQKRKLKIWPVEEFTELRFSYKPEFAIDIETWSGNIDCVGAAWNETEAVVIPTYTRKLRKKWLPLVKALCESDNEKIMQTGGYDTYWLKRSWGIDVLNYKWDTAGMSHALDPIQNHSLDHLASIHTFPRLNYWKDESKSASNLRNSAEIRERAFKYSAKDTTATGEIKKRLETRLIAEGLLGFYLIHYARLHKPLLKMMLRGWPVDTDAQKKLATGKRLQCVKIREQLSAYAGFDLYATKDFSPKKLKTFLIDTLGMKPNKKWGKEPLDKKALLAMQLREPLLSGPAIGLLLEHRHLQKEIEKLANLWHFDNRMRYSLHYRTEAGRLGSGKAHDGFGMSIQTVNR